MLFRHHGAAGLPEGLQHRRLVEGLNGRDIEHFGADAFSLKGFRSLQGFPYKVPAGDDSDILAFIHIVHLADLEGCVRVGEIGHRRASETKIYGAVPLCCGNGGLLGLVEIARNHDNHTGEGAHKGDVLHRLVRRTVFAEGDACVRRSDFHIGVAVCHFLAELVIHTAGHELGEGADERNLACYCETCCSADHIGFGDAALDESLGKFSRKSIHLERTLQVRGKCKDTAVLASGLKEPRSEAASGIYLTLVSVFLHFFNNHLMFLQAAS